MGSLRRGGSLPVAIVAAALGAVLVASVILAVTFGPADITPGEVWSSVLHHLGVGTGTGGRTMPDAAIGIIPVRFGQRRMGRAPDRRRCATLDCGAYKRMVEPDTSGAQLNKARRLRRLELARCDRVPGYR